MSAFVQELIHLVLALAIRKWQILKILFGIWNKAFLTNQEQIVYVQMGLGNFAEYEPAMLKSVL